MKQIFNPAYALILANGIYTIAHQCTIYTDDESNVRLFATEQEMRTYMTANNITVIEEPI